MRNPLFTQWAMGKCFYCNRETYRTGHKCVAHTYTRDHIIPKPLRRISLQQYMKGRTCHLFTVTCCYECNHKKGCQSTLRYAFALKLPPEKLKVINTAYTLNRRSVHAHI